MKISVVVPLYKCSKYLNELYERLTNTLKDITDNYEIIFVNDSSPEEDWKLVFVLGQKDKKVKGINLSRNFGQHYAIWAGLKESSGDWIVVMDCDLQDQPEEIKKLFRKAQEGYEIVLARRINRKDNFFKRLSSKIFYKLLGYLTETEQDPTIANFGIYHRKVIKAILNMKDYIKYFPTMVQWVGFNKTSIEIEHAPRKYDKSSYSIKKLLELAFNVIFTFSDKPLRLIINFGFFIVFFSILLAIYYLYKYLSGQIIVLGYASVIISILFLFGLNFVIIGGVGVYIGKIFNQTKNRPIVIIKEKINF